MSRSKPEPLHMQVHLPEGIEFPPITSTALPIPNFSEEDKEDGRRRNQARLSHLLKRNTKDRLFPEHQSNGDSGRNSLLEARCELSRARVRELESMLPRPRNNWFFRLSVQLIPEKPENLPFWFHTFELEHNFCSGILEACPSGFTFTPIGASGGECVRFKDTDVIRSFFLREYDAMPILLFHLRHKNVGFLCDTQDLTSFEDFIAGVSSQKWDSQSYFFPFVDLSNGQFKGRFQSGNRAEFALTSCALIRLDILPKCVVLVPLIDIEIVNLARDVTSEKILMTVVFQDFSRKVLQIFEIDLSMLTFIKERLNFADVKYYCNDRCSEDWNDKLREIQESPKTFVDAGGWESLHLEDEPTLSYYNKTADEGLWMEGYFH